MDEPRRLVVAVIAAVAIVAFIAFARGGGEPRRAGHVTVGHAAGRGRRHDERLNRERVVRRAGADAARRRVR